MSLVIPFMPKWNSKLFTPSFYGQWQACNPWGACWRVQFVGKSWLAQKRWINVSQKIWKCNIMLAVCWGMLWAWSLYWDLHFWVVIASKHCQASSHVGCNDMWNPHGCVGINFTRVCAVYVFMPVFLVPMCFVVVIILVGGSRLL